MKKPVGKYSLGMRQRLGIAQAIMEDPQILILDEPFNGLDKAVAENMRKLLLELKEEGKTILLASHNQADIDQLCDTVCEMDAGVMTMIRDDRGEQQRWPARDGENTGEADGDSEKKEAAEGEKVVTEKAVPPKALIPELDLLDNAAILLTVQGVAKRERRRLAGRVLDRMGLSGVHHARPSMVTERQRRLTMEARELALQEYGIDGTKEN